MKKIALLLLLTLMPLVGFSKTISITGRVDNISMQEAVEKVMEEHRSLPIEKPIVLALNSPGGSVYAGYFLMNQMISLQAEGRKFTAIVTGMCASMCFNILQVADIRGSLPFATIMQHLPFGGDKQHLEAIERVMDKLTAKRLGIHHLLWKQIARQNLWVGSDDALKMNVIDAVYIEKNLGDIMNVEESTFNVLKTRGEVSGD